MENTRYGTFSEWELNWFWDVIELARPVDNDPEVHCGKLGELFEEHAARRIVIFARIFYGYKANAYHYDLWDIAYHIHGSCSDESFSHFREWLVMQGRDVYKLALNDPESLGELITTAYVLEMECSFIDSAYEKVTGESSIPIKLLMPQGNPGHLEPKGERSSDSDEFARRYPMLSRLLDDFPEINPHWQQWNNNTIPRMAQTIHDTKTWADLPILADALEQSGCTDSFLLDHLRANRKHARQCWAVDLILNTFHPEPSN